MTRPASMTFKIISRIPIFPARQNIRPCRSAETIADRNYQSCAWSWWQSMVEGHTWWKDSSTVDSVNHSRRMQQPPRNVTGTVAEGFRRGWALVSDSYILECENQRSDVGIESFLLCDASLKSADPRSLQQMKLTVLVRGNLHMESVFTRK